MRLHDGVGDGAQEPFHLDIKNAGDKWHILLSQGKRTSGISTWVLTYGADLAATNMVGLTGKQREMVYRGFEEFRRTLKYGCLAAHYGYE